MTQNITKAQRFALMVLDHFIMTIAAFLFFLPAFIEGIKGAFKVSHEQGNPEMFGHIGYLSMLGFALYFCKDCINGRSPAKRILKFQLVDHATGEVASPIRYFVRDLFIVIWPVEFIVALVNPERRIGDLVAGTRLVRFDPETAQPRPNWLQVGISLAISYGIMLFLLMWMKDAESEMKFQIVNYDEASYNEVLSKETEQFFNDSLGDLLRADVRVYDSIANEDLKYVSVIFHLKQNLISDEENTSTLGATTVHMLYRKFPAETFVGRLQYSFRIEGFSTTSSLYIGDEKLKVRVGTEHPEYKSDEE